jgi:hypothetical protein
MTGDGVSSRAECIQAGRHRPGWTADAGTGEEKSVVVAGPGAAAVGLRREKHADSVVTGLELAANVGKVDSLPIGDTRPRCARRALRTELECQLDRMEGGEACGACCVGGHRRSLGEVDATHPDQAEGLQAERPSEASRA